MRVHVTGDPKVEKASAVKFVARFVEDWDLCPCDVVKAMTGSDRVAISIPEEGSFEAPILRQMSSNMSQQYKTLAKKLSEHIKGSVNASMVAE